MVRTLGFQAAFFSVMALQLACGGGARQSRIVDVPVGKAVSYGAERDVRYVAELDPARDDVRIHVFREAKCDVVPLDVMQRYEEILEGNEVVSRTPLNKTQSAGPSQTAIACGQTYVRNTDVMLETESGGRFSLGKTDSMGQVRANLMQVFQVASYGELPSQVKVVLRPPQGARATDAGKLRLGELGKHEERVRALLAEMQAILAKGETGASPAEITQSYQLYEQLFDIAATDPRTTGVSTRFWELFAGRKMQEARGRLVQNLDALGKARETLKAMGDAAIPLYVQVAVSSGVMDQRALEWSSLRLIRAIRGVPTVCSSGFAFSNMGRYGLPVEAVLSAEYLRFGYGDEFQGALASVCR